MGLLTLDISISSYTIILFSLFFSIFYTTGKYKGQGTAEAPSTLTSGGYRQIHLVCTDINIAWLRFLHFLYFFVTGTMRAHRAYGSRSDDFFRGLVP